MTCEFQFLNYSPWKVGSEWGNIGNSLLFVMGLQAVPVPVPSANNSLLRETGESSQIESNRSQPASQPANNPSKQQWCNELNMHIFLVPFSISRDAM